MLSVKEAVGAAARALVELYPDHVLQEVLLEEVEMTEDDKYWLVTLSFVPVERSAPSDVFLQSVTGKRPDRRYRVVRINATTGAFTSMKTPAA